MTWFKVDDSFYDHPKVFDAPDCAVALWVRAGTWCARNLTDGFVPAKLPARLCDDPEQATRELVERGLWIEVAGGYQFHQWDERQPTRAQVEHERKLKTDRQRRWRDNKSGRYVDARVDASTDASRDGAVEPAPSRPVPSRRDRDGTGSQSSSRRNAREHAPEDDDGIDLAIVELLTESTGQPISILWAAKVRQRILNGRHVAPRARMAYVTKAIRDNPSKFMPPAEPSAPALRAVPDWCGTCDERTRLLDVEGAPVVRCPACHPLERQEAS